MLAGESIIALAKMKDEEFRASIEKIILDTKNPRLIIMGAEALGIYHNHESVPVLLQILRRENIPPFLRDEIILEIAEIIGTQKKFYKILARYAVNNSLASALAMDEVESTLEFVKNAMSKKKEKFKAHLLSSYTERFQNAVSSYVNENNGVELTRWILDLPGEHSKSSDFINSIFSEVVIDEDLLINDCLKLLIVHWAALELRIWAAMVK